MLARSVVVLAFVVALATALVHSCAVLARARVHRIAATAVARSFDLALARTQAQLAGAIARGADPRTAAFVPTAFAPSCASARADGTCALTISTATAPTTTLAIASEPAGACLPLCANDLQGNDAIEEGRFALRISVRAIGGTGTSFATRDRYALFRTTRLPPYASLIGTRDASGESIVAGIGEGEDAGTPALTTVDVRYVNAATGASMEGNAWQTRPWANADAGATAWQP